MKNLILALSCLSTFSILAADGSSGCGPGWYVFKQNSLVSSSLRATTNGILWPSVTLGMTLGTSNCTKHSIVQTEKESLYFTTQNYFELQKEIAKGYGPHLTAYAKTIGCKIQDADYLGEKLQGNFEKLFKSESVNPENTLIEVYKTIFTDERLVHSCSLT